MRIVAISCVRDEADMVEAFVRHTLRVAERLFILDNGSTDGTLEILRSLEREGLPLEIEVDPSLGYFQRERMTRLLHRAAANGASDWILCLDCDELVMPSEGKSLAEELAGQDLERPLEVDWYTHVPDDGDDPAERNPALRLGHRLVARSGKWRKVLVPGRLAARPGVALAAGNHALLQDGDPLPAGELLGHLAHFPLRSGPQLAARVVLHRLQYQTMPGIDPQWGFHHSNAFRLLSTSPRAFFEQFHARSTQWYAPVGAEGEERELKPFPYLGGPLLYTPPLEEGLDRALAGHLRYAESLAQAYARAQAGKLEAERRASESEAQRAQAEAAAQRAAARESEAARASVQLGEALAQATLTLGEADARAEAAARCSREAESRRALAESAAAQAESAAAQAVARANALEAERFRLQAALDEMAASRAVRLARAYAAMRALLLKS